MGLPQAIHCYSLNQIIKYPFDLELLLFKCIEIYQKNFIAFR